MTGNIIGIKTEIIVKIPKTATNKNHKTKDIKINSFEINLKSYLQDKN
jgi:hypothetical protein